MVLSLAQPFSRVPGGQEAILVLLTSPQCNSFPWLFFPYWWQVGVVCGNLAWPSPAQPHSPAAQWLCPSPYMMLILPLLVNTALLGSLMWHVTVGIFKGAT